MQSMNLTNHFLIAMPAMDDPYFSKSLIFIAEHNDQGALGLIVNRPIELNLAALFEKIDVALEAADVGKLPVYFGGPVQTDRGFVLHPAGHDFQATLDLGELGLSTSQDALFAIADNNGPDKYLITLGYAGWGAGQLENELAENAWLSCPVDPAILFDMPHDQRLQAAARPTLTEALLAEHARADILLPPRGRARRRQPAAFG